MIVFIIVSTGTVSDKIYVKVSSTVLGSSLDASRSQGIPGKVGTHFKRLFLAKGLEEGENN